MIGYLRDTTLGALVIAAALTSSAAQVRAHHSYVVLFDPSQTISVTGIVTEFQFIAPHAYIHVDVTDENGTLTKWELETTSPGQLIRAGLMPEMLQPGDQISAVGNPTRDGRPLMRLLTITLPSGEQKRIQ